MCVFFLVEFLVGYIRLPNWKQSNKRTQTRVVLLEMPRHEEKKYRTGTPASSKLLGSLMTKPPSDTAHTDNKRDQTDTVSTLGNTPHPSAFSAEHQPNKKHKLVKEECAVVLQKRSNFNVIPDCLHNLGNVAAWRKVSTHLATQPHLPIVISGPTGVGKSKGVEALLRTNSTECLTLDGADGESTEELLAWVKRFRRLQVNTKGQRFAIFLDDFESFTSEFKERFGQYLRDGATDVHLGILVITCTSFRQPDNYKVLSKLTNVPLYPPKEVVLRMWLRRHHVWHLPNGTESVARRGFPTDIVDLEKELLLKGDIRQAAIALEHHMTTGKLLQTNTECFYSNAFDATRKLFTHRCDWQWWANHAEERDVSLLQQSALTVHTQAQGQLGDDMVQLLDTLCDCTSNYPVGWEMRGQQQSYNMAVAALATHSTIHAQDVQALYPPKHHPNRATLRKEKNAGEDVSWHWLDFLEIPQCLGGLPLLHGGACRDQSKK